MYSVVVSMFTINSCPSASFLGLELHSHLSDDEIHIPISFPSSFRGALASIDASIGLNMANLGHLIRSSQGVELTKRGVAQVAPVDVIMTTPLVTPVDVIEVMTLQPLCLLDGRCKG